MLKIIYQDQSLLVIDKTAGISADALSNILNSKYNIQLERGGLVHRLDQDTSGLIVAAKDQTSFDRLQRQFKERTVNKEYLTLVHGQIEKDGLVAGGIGRNPLHREKFTVLKEGRKASTSYQVIGHLVMDGRRLQSIFLRFSKVQIKKLLALHYPLFTLLKCFPQTGRTHQIRVHLKYIGHPIVADKKYAGRKTARWDQYWCPRQFLHAGRLEFDHPTIGERMSFESPMPSDLTRALNYLTKQNK